MSFTKLEKFSAIIFFFEYSFIPTFSILLLGLQWYEFWDFVIVPQFPEALFILFPVYFLFFILNKFYSLVLKFINSILCYIHSIIEPNQWGVLFCFLNFCYCIFQLYHFKLVLFNDFYFFVAIFYFSFVSGEFVTVH